MQTEQVPSLIQLIYLRYHHFQSGLHQIFLFLHHQTSSWQYYFEQDRMDQVVCATTSKPSRTEMKKETLMIKFVILILKDGWKKGFREVHQYWCSITQHKQCFTLLPGASVNLDHFYHQIWCLSEYPSYWEILLDKQSHFHCQISSVVTHVFRLFYHCNLQMKLSKK